MESSPPTRDSLRTLARILPRIESDLADSISSDAEGWSEFLARVEQHFPTLFSLYLILYSGQYDFFFYLEDLLKTLARSWFARPSELRNFDRLREAHPLWYQSNQMLGGVCYVDLFAGNLEGVKAKIPYFKELGLTYLHLLPFFKIPEGENDGGYAVSSYREVHAALGSMDQLESLTQELRAAGISLVLDLVFNHTSDEHDWAERAKAGDDEYLSFYRIFPSRAFPDIYERTLREIFPDEHPGAFSLFPGVLPTRISEETEGTVGDRGWVWTTFHTYQWDLNYGNPAVFNRMAEEMLYLGNKGTEVIRLDAVAFIWKQMGTNCENLPGAHSLIQAFNAVARIASPALIFKSEAIVHPDEVVKYLSPAECQLSYNPLIMALLWNSLATRKVDLLAQALKSRFTIPDGTAWVNYVRVHDDIGWTFSDEDAALLGINAYDHRQFLNEFYRGRFPGSFAKGLPFQENPETGDCRISGTCASLAGLEKALTEEGPIEVELAIRRILLIHGIILTIGGIPLLYLGDEIGTLNDYTYLDDPAQSRDSRWVHRPRADWEKYTRRNDSESIEGRVFHGLKRLITIRKENRVFSVGTLEVLPSANEHVLGFVKSHASQRALLVANFSESDQRVPLEIASRFGGATVHGSTEFAKTGIILPYEFQIVLE